EIVIVARAIEQVKGLQLAGAVVGNPPECKAVLRMLAMKAFVIYHRAMVRIIDRIIKHGAIAYTKFFNPNRSLFPFAVAEVLALCGVAELNVIPVGKVALSIRTTPRDTVVESQDNLWCPGK